MDLGIALPLPTRSVTALQSRRQKRGQACPEYLLLGAGDIVVDPHQLDAAGFVVVDGETGSGVLVSRLA